MWRRIIIILVIIWTVITAILLKKGLDTLNHHIDCEDPKVISYHRISKIWNADSQLISLIYSTLIRTLYSNKFSINSGEFGNYISPVNYLISRQKQLFFGMDIIKAKCDLLNP